MATRPPMEKTPTGTSLTVFSDAQSLATGAATIIAEEARRAVDNAGRFTVALAGGSTPRPVYELLAAPPLASQMPWQDTEVFWGDERCVDPVDPRSNELMARETLLNHVPIRADHVHPMRCAGLGVANATGAVRYGEGAAHRAADEYERLLRRLFPEDGQAETPGPGLDLVLLGLGDNGHTASLFPGSPALDEMERWAVAALEDPGTAAATSGTGERRWRVTLSAPFINRAALVLFVVSGAAKAAAVRGVLQADGDPHELPARLIHPPAGRLWWLLDKAAASLLESDGDAGRTIS